VEGIRREILVLSDGVDCVTEPLNDSSCKRGLGVAINKAAGFDLKPV
jgi:hypothetical protein